MQAPKQRRRVASHYVKTLLAGTAYIRVSECRQVSCEGRSKFRSCLWPCRKRLRANAPTVPLHSLKSRTSEASTFPPTPVPGMISRSMPRSFASTFANGEAFTGPLLTIAGDDSCVCFD